MSNIFNDIGKRMPYPESREYLDNLIDAVTDKAIAQQNKPGGNRIRRWAIASAAAVALLIVGFGVIFFNEKGTQQVTLDGQGPLDEFLNSLSDEEAAQLPFYEMEEIPEY